eukprot:3600258-Prymnesium_polylepis.1
MVGVRLACYAPPAHPPPNNCAPCSHVPRCRTAPPTPSVTAPYRGQANPGQQRPSGHLRPSAQEHRPGGEAPAVRPGQ